MKTVVSLQDLLELEIHPEGLHAQYQERLARDVADRWRAAALDVPCPGCGAAKATPAFERLGARYCECPQCRSLYVTPRLDEAALVDFYRRSPASIFWRERVWPATAAARLEKIAQPRLDWVRDGLVEHASEASVGLDLSPYSGPFIDLMCAGGRYRMTAGSWLADLDVSRPPAGARVQPLTLETLEQCAPVDFVTAFDTVDRAPDLPQLIDRLTRVVRPGGLLFLTAPNADGFDHQVLWERHPALVPPDKLNILSIAGLQRRLGEPDWELLEISTPGMFDVEQVRRAVDADPRAAWPRFVWTLVEARDATAQLDLQEYLQRHRLASFARVVARRL